MLCISFFENCKHDSIVAFWKSVGVEKYMYTINDHFYTKSEEESAMSNLTLSKWQSKWASWTL